MKAFRVVALLVLALACVAGASDTAGGEEAEEEPVPSCGGDTLILMEGAPADAAACYGPNAECDGLRTWCASQSDGMTCHLQATNDGAVGAKRPFCVSKAGCTPEGAIENLLTSLMDTNKFGSWCTDSGDATDCSIKYSCPGVPDGVAAHPDSGMSAATKGAIVAACSVALVFGAFCCQAGRAVNRADDEEAHHHKPKFHHSPMHGKVKHKHAEPAPEDGAHASKAQLALADKFTAVAAPWQGFPAAGDEDSEDEDDGPKHKPVYGHARHNGRARKSPAKKKRTPRKKKKKAAPALTAAEAALFSPGSRVKVWWPKKGRHFEGTVTGGAAAEGAVDVRYDDGSTEAGVPLDAVSAAGAGGGAGDGVVWVDTP